jgi:post-segregation antitoxin (ccd killing protein)
MPTTKTPAKTLNVRLDPDTLQDVKKAASRHNMSANSFILTAIDAQLKAERDREWREGFEAMGRDPESSDVEYMLPAAREVVLGD